jgi:hypothetical protein
MEKKRKMTMKMVTFTANEIHQIMLWAYDREQESAAQGLRDKNPVADHNRTEVAEMGVMGEMAVAKALGIPYEYTVNTFLAPDVVLPNGRKIQVKATKHRDGHLIVTRFNPKTLTMEDLPPLMAEPYVLTYVNIPYAFAEVGGWCTAAEAHYLVACRILEWDRTKRVPSIWVPQKYLRPLETIWEEKGLTWD